MNNLKSQINSLSKETKALIDKRLDEFSSFSKKGNEEWFSELCFCILTANAKQKTAENIQNKLGNKLLTINQKELSDFIKNNKHRFHNNKSKYIIEARKHKNIKDILENKSEVQARSWLVDNVKGLGMKEASHFLRNTGSQDLAILDRHILGLMETHELIERPKTLTSKSYLEIEAKFKSLAKELNMSSAKLDLYFWFVKNNEVAK